MKYRVVTVHNDKYKIQYKSSLIHTWRDYEFSILSSGNRIVTYDNKLEAINRAKYLTEKESFKEEQVWP